MKASLIQKFAVLSVVVFTALSAAPTQAAPYTINATDLATINTIWLGGPDQANPGFLYSISDYNGAAYPLMRFDLSGLAGQTVQANGSLTMTVGSMWPFNLLTADLRLYTLTQAYDPNTATWNNTIGNLGSLVDAQSPTFESFDCNYPNCTSPGQTVTFTLSQSLLQSWLDSPSTNYGLVLTYPGHSDWQDHSDISWQLPVQLNVDAVPEPQAIATLLTGLGMLGFVTRRKIQK